MRFILFQIMFYSFSRVFGQDSSYQFTTSDGVSLYLRTAGRGYPVLFIPGGPGNTSNYFEALPIAKILEKHYRMIYYDQRGGGRSASSQDSNYSMDRMELDIEEIRNFLKLRQWSIIGHSFGGLVMTAYARSGLSSSREETMPSTPKQNVSETKINW